MSRVGREPITIPANVQVEMTPDEIVVTGPKGSLRHFTMPEVIIKQDGDQLVVSRQNDEKTARSKHGLMRSLINNMVVGVTEGFQKRLEINGVGFRVNVSGQQLNLTVGFSHPVQYRIPDNIEVTVDGNVMTITGIDKQKVGQIAAEIRAVKKPEPYKGKGIKYSNEVVIRKAGKTAGGEK